MVVGFGVVWGKVAVYNRLIVIVPRFGLVDVLRGQRRREGQEWRDHEQCRSTSDGTNHPRIIEGRRRGVNPYEVTTRSETGQ